MQSNFQSFILSFTTLTIFVAVMSGPDGIFTGSFRSVASSLTCVPPTSMTRILGDFSAVPAFMFVVPWNVSLFPFILAPQGDSQSQHIAWPWIVFMNEFRHALFPSLIEQHRYPIL